MVTLAHLHTFKMRQLHQQHYDVLGTWIVLTPLLAESVGLVAFPETTPGFFRSVPARSCSALRFLGVEG